MRQSPGELEEEQAEFVWDRCLNDQMFVFQESELGRILDIIITNMTPQRSPSQKPVPANILFLSARYAHYHASSDLLATLLVTAMDKINDVVERHQWDMTILAFWISNATLLLHYLKKDAHLSMATTEFQLQLAELVNEIFILIIRDAERRMDKSFDAAMLDHETIPGFEDVQFQNEWKIFRSSKKPSRAPMDQPLDKRFRPPSPKRRAGPSPRTITSLLSSTLFVLDLYDIHSVITSQILAQLLYWLGAELFNRIMSNRRYLARTKAMQIRMNVSVLEDWARANNRIPEHFENGSTTSTGENTVEATRRHLEPVIQLLQWLQCFSSLGEDLDALKNTVECLPRLTPQQLIHAVKHYRPEVGERGLNKPSMKWLLNLQNERAETKRKSGRVTNVPNTPTRNGVPYPSQPSNNPFPSADQNSNVSSISPPPTPTISTSQSRLPEESDIPVQSQSQQYEIEEEEPEPPPLLLLDPALMLPFSLPTSTDMLISYGAGFGGTNRERERKYIPSVPAEFLSKFETSTAGNGRSGWGGGELE